MKKIFFLVFLFSFTFVDAKVTAELFSRWNINNASLLIDQGKYFEALESYNSAIEATNEQKLLLEGLLDKANLLSLYLDEKSAALKIYKEIYKKYRSTKEAEFALYQACMLSYKLNLQDTKELFDKYMLNYKHGKFYFQLKYLKNKIQIVKKIEEKPQKIVQIQQPQQPKIVPKNPKLKKIFVRVLLVRNKKNITLTGDFNVKNINFNKINLSVKENKVYFNHRLYDKLIIKSKKSFKISSKKYKYSGDIYIITRKGKLRVLNYLDIDEYIKGVVTSESIASWNIEALKAQAVASRTYAYFQSKVRKNWDYDVVDNTGDQVYKGISGWTKKGLNAVEQTQYEVMFYKNKPIFSQYTANSGWVNSSSNEIFGVYKSYLYRHPDNYSQRMPLGHWKKHISISVLSKKLYKMGIDLGKLQDVVPFQITKSGRVVKVKFIGSRGSKVFRTYSSLRRAVGLRDILFTIKKRDGVLYFNGGGFGHGVGYSQWGGQAMAKDGYKYNKILKFYYKDINIKKIN